VSWLLFSILEESNVKKLFFSVTCFGGGLCLISALPIHPPGVPATDEMLPRNDVEYRVVDYHIVTPDTVLAAVPVRGKTLPLRTWTDLYHLFSVTPYS
jgi:hypothetical protein